MSSQVRSVVMKNTKHLTKGSICPVLAPGVLRCYSMKYCPFAQRTRIILSYKNIPHEVVNINLINKPEWFVKKFPLSKVPALEQDGKFIYESMVISDYIEEQYPNPPLYPAASWVKAEHRCLIQLWTKVTDAFLRMMFLKDPTRLPKLIEDLKAGLELFEDELKQKKSTFFSGNSVGMIDYMIWPWYERLPLIKHFTGEMFSDDSLPCLTAWSTSMMKDPAIQSTYITPEEHLAYIVNRKDGIPDYDMNFERARL